MSEENKMGQDAQNKTTDAPNTAEVDMSSLPEATQRYIAALRHEAAERRVALKKLEEEMAKREQARLAEEGRWKELAEKREVELQKLMPYQQRAEALEATLRESNTQRMKRLPEDMQAIVPVDYAPEKLAAWLDANLEKLLKPVAPNLDGGAGAGGSSRTTLTDEQRTMARRMNMTDEQFAQQLAKLRSNQ
jgi:hypothetical protein